MSARVKSKHSNGTYETFITDEPFDKVRQELIRRNGEIVSLHWEPITYKGKEIKA